MSKRFFKTLFAFCILIGMFSLVLLAGAADTTVKEISTPQELVNLMKKAEGYDWTGSYKLINDVSLEGFDQNPIGTESDPFMGVLTAAIIR